MMDEEAKKWKGVALRWALFTLLFMGLFIAMLIGYATASADYAGRHAEAVKAGHGHYEPDESGAPVFTWNEPCRKGGE